MKTFNYNLVPILTMRVSKKMRKHISPGTGDGHLDDFDTWTIQYPSQRLGALRMGVPYHFVIITSGEISYFHLQDAFRSTFLGTFVVPIPV